MSISQMDLVFCVDVTNSMSPFIMKCRSCLVQILEHFAANTRADLRVAIVGYRDYGVDVDSPYEDLLEVHPFTSNSSETRATLNRLCCFSPRGNSDAAEAVFAGLDACLNRLEWRLQSFHVIVLVGDAPPHACGANPYPFPDRFRERDPTGHTLDTMIAAAEDHGCFLYSLGMLPSVFPIHDPILEYSFSALSNATGGVYSSAQNADVAIQIVEKISQKVFGELEQDRALWEEMELAMQSLSLGETTNAVPTPALFSHVARQIGVTEQAANESVARLQKRNIF